MGWRLSEIVLRSLPKIGSVDNVAERRIGFNFCDLMITWRCRNYVLREMLDIELLFVPNALIDFRATDCIFKIEFPVAFSLLIVR